ncbi:hypothetical protein KY362_08435 [Candidatus Woesearchaeota archaeon]|nr:hypothetical protein [Candidatus Woesearchaeota archaeon]
MPAKKPTKTVKGNPVKGKEAKESSAKKTPPPRSMRSKLEDDLRRIEADIKRLKTSAKRGIKVEEAALLSKDIKTTPRPAYSMHEVDADRLKQGITEASRGTAAYVLTILLSAGILAYLFGSAETYVAYVLCGVVLWKFIHQHHESRSHILHSFFSTGVMIIPLYLLYFLFNDLFGLVVCVLYAMSFVIAGLLYIFHTKRGHKEELHVSFPKTLLAMIYSHFLAAALASSMAYILMTTLLTDSFKSVFTISATIIFPTLLVYFFLTKFLYLRFFDRVHVKREVLKGLKHGAAYAALFVVCIIFAYMLTAVQLTTSAKADYRNIMDDVVLNFPNIRADIAQTAFDHGTTELSDTKTARDMIAETDRIKRQANDLKRQTDTLSFSLYDYISDTYMTKLTETELEVKQAHLLAKNAEEAKDDLLREYEKVSQMKAEARYDDGSTSMSEHHTNLNIYVSGYVPYEPLPEVRYLREKIESGTDSYTSLLSDEMLFDFALVYSPETRRLLPGKSRFSRAAHELLQHTKLFRDFMILVFESSASEAQEIAHPSMTEALYNGRSADETMMSQILRYRIIKSNIEATKALAE